MLMSRRQVLLAGIAASALPLASCATLSGKDYLAEAAAAFAAGSVALTVLTGLVAVGTLSKDKARGYAPYVDGVAAAFDVLHQDVDNGVTLTQVIIDQALQALSLLQQVTSPVVQKMSATDKDLVLQMHAQKAKAFPVIAVISFVISNLSTFISLGGQIKDAVTALINQFQGGTESGTTVAQVDAAYANFTSALAGWRAAIA